MNKIEKMNILTADDIENAFGFISDLSDSNYSFSNIEDVIKRSIVNNMEFQKAVQILLIELYRIIVAVIPKNEVMDILSETDVDKDLFNMLFKDIPFKEE